MAQLFSLSGFTSLQLLCMALLLILLVHLHQRRPEDAGVRPYNDQGDLYHTTW